MKMLKAPFSAGMRPLRLPGGSCTHERIGFWWKSRKMIFSIVTAIHSFCFQQTATAHICTCWLSHNTGDIMALLLYVDIESWFSPTLKGMRQDPPCEENRMEIQYLNEAFLVLCVNEKKKILMYVGAKCIYLCIRHTFTKHITVLIFGAKEPSTRIWQEIICSCFMTKKQAVKVLNRFS